MATLEKEAVSINSSFSLELGYTILAFVGAKEGIYSISSLAAKHLQEITILSFLQTHAFKKFWPVLFLLKYSEAHRFYICIILLRKLHLPFL